MICGKVSFGIERSLQPQYQIQTTIVHIAGKLHVVVDGVIYRLDAVRVVICELGVVRCLDVLVNDAVDYTKGVEIELDA